MKKTAIVLAVLVILLIGTGVAVYSVLRNPPARQAANASPTPVELPPVDSSVKVALTKAKAANTVTLSISGMDSKMSSVDYELTYDSHGLIRGVNSGSNPIDVSGKDAFDRDIYMGTCSKGDCTPDTGVSKISVALEFTAKDGKKYQFSKDFTL